MKPRLRWVCWAVVVAAVPGCVLMGPDYKRPQNTVPAQFTQSLDTAGTPQAAVPIGTNWWQLYQDPQLNTLVAQALQNNTDIKLAVARVEEADAYLREVGAALLPEVDLNASGARTRITGLGPTPLFAGIRQVSNDYKATLGTSFELDFWGKLRRAKESARAQALSTHYAKDTVALSLQGLVVSNYLQLRSLEAQIAVSQDSLHSREESLALTKRRLEGGVASALDVHQAEVASSNLVAQIADLVRQREIIANQLAILTGVLDLKLAAGNINTLPIPPIPPIGLPSSLLEARPDIAEAEQNMVEANANIGVAKAAFFPSISLTANYGGESTQLDDILKSPARIWSGGLSLSLPVFDAGRLSSRVDQATAKQKQALASYEGSIQTAFREVNDALVTLRQNGDRETALQTSQSAARKALDVASNRYKSGYAGYLDVLDSQRTYNDAALAFIQSRQARLVATVDLFKALGGGWKPQ